MDRIQVYSGKLKHGPYKLGIMRIDKNPRIIIPGKNIQIIITDHWVEVKYLDINSKLFFDRMNISIEVGMSRF